MSFLFFCLVVASEWWDIRIILSLNATPFFECVRLWWVNLLSETEFSIAFCSSFLWYSKANSSRWKALSWHDMFTVESTRHVLSNKPGLYSRLKLLLGRLTIIETPTRNIPKWQRRPGSFSCPGRDNAKRLSVHVIVYSWFWPVTRCRQLYWCRNLVPRLTILEQRLTLLCLTGYYHKPSIAVTLGTRFGHHSNT